MTRASLLLIVSTALAVSACHRNVPAGDPPAVTDSKPPLPHQVTVDAAQLSSLRIDAPSHGAPPQAIRATGAVEFNADRLVRMVAPVSGQVHELSVNIGDSVSQGAVLFVLDSRDVAAAVADYRASRSDLELAEKTQAMTQDLYDHQVASRMSLQQSASDLAKAQAKVQQTQEVLAVLGLDPSHDQSGLEARVAVRAPFAGTVVDRTAANGQLVGPENGPVVSIADLSTVWVDADVFERDLRNIAEGQTADVTTTAYPDDRFAAKVSRIGAVVDSQTRTAKVRFLVTNEGHRLKPGMFAETTLFRPAPSSALTLPESAAFVEDGKSYTYVQVAPKTFERRAIEVTPCGAHKVEVLSGLDPGARVVVEGALFLQQLESDAGSR
jgi:cobalt-zinc-cadmium efflux system membrane fusion protein